MTHRWKKLDAPSFSYGGVQGTIEWFVPKSDVYTCENCFQMCLAEVGGSPNENLMPDLKECGEAIVERIQKL